MPPGMLCGAVQELHRCLAPLGNLLDITILDVMEKDPLTPSIPTERVSSLELKPEPPEEEPISLLVPNIQEAVEPEGAACPGELALMQRSLPLAPPEFTRSWADKSDPPPRGCSLTGQYNPQGPAGPKLLGIHVGNSLP